jgi:hypothetical protein
MAARKRGPSFKRGTTAYKASERIVKAIKRGRKSGAINPYAVARAVAKKMSPAKRRKLARRK